MSLKDEIIGKLVQLVLESPFSPLGWLNGWKTVIGNLLTIISGCLLAVQETMCPGWQYCDELGQANAVILFLMSLLVKLVGEWHRKDKALRLGI